MPNSCKYKQVASPYLLRKTRQTNCMPKGYDSG